MNRDLLILSFSIHAYVITCTLIYLFLTELSRICLECKMGSFARKGVETWYDVQLHQGQKFFPKKWSILSEQKTSWAQVVNKMSRPWCNMIGNGVTKSKVIINAFIRIYFGLKGPYSIDSLEESLVQTICFHTIAV